MRRGADTLEAGQRVGDYVIEARLGAGGMATVYRARHLVLDSLHAIKALHAEYRASAEVRRRFLDEGRIQAKHLLHPNIVRVTNIVATEEVAGLVMDFVDGGNLDDYIAARPRPLSKEPFLAMALPLLDALRHAHDAGVIHRDLKPANILLRRTSAGLVPLLTDFGIAKIVTPADSLHAKATHHDAKMGTVGYSSPEQIASAKNVTERSDVFSLAAVFYEIATGRTPFGGGSDFEIMERIVHGRFEPPVKYVDVDMPLVICDAISRALHPDPRARFASCAEFAEALRANEKPVLSRQRQVLGLDRLPARDAGSSANMTRVHVPVRGRDFGRSECDVPSRPRSRMGMVVVATALVGAIIGLITFAIHEGRDPKPMSSRAKSAGKGPALGSAGSGGALAVRGSSVLSVFMEDFGNWIAAADRKLVASALSPNVFAIGPRDADLAYDADTAAAMIVSGLPRVTASPGTSATTVFARTGDQGVVGYFDLELRGASVYRLTAVAQLTAAGWRIDALHLSRAHTPTEERDLLGAGKPPARIAIADYVPRVTQGLGKFAAASLTSADAFEESFAMNETTFTLIGSEPSQRYVGPSKARQEFHSWELTASISGPMRVGLAAGSPLGWVATSVDVEFDGGAVPFRCLLAYRDGADGWRLVQAHFSTNAR